MCHLDIVKPCCVASVSVCSRAAPTDVLCTHRSWAWRPSGPLWTGCSSSCWPSRWCFPVCRRSNCWAAAATWSSPTSSGCRCSHRRHAGLNIAQDQILYTESTWPKLVFFTSELKLSPGRYRPSTQVAADLGLVLAVVVERHLAVRGRPQQTERLHGGSEVGLSDERVDGAHLSIHDQLQVRLVRTEAQGVVVTAVVVREEPLFLLKDTRKGTLDSFKTLRYKDVWTVLNFVLHNLSAGPLNLFVPLWFWSFFLGNADK